MKGSWEESVSLSLLASGFSSSFLHLQNQQQEIRASYTILLTPSFASKDPCNHIGPTQESRIIPLRSSDLASLIPPVTVIPYCPITYIQRFWALGCGHFGGLGICLPQHIMPKCPIETSHSLQYSMKRTIHHYFTNSRHCLSVCQWTISQIVFFFFLHHLITKEPRHLSYRVLFFFCQEKLVPSAKISKVFFVCFSKS